MLDGLQVDLLRLVVPNLLLLLLNFVAAVSPLLSLLFLLLRAIFHPNIFFPVVLSVKILNVILVLRKITERLFFFPSCERATKVFW